MAKFRRIRKGRIDGIDDVKQREECVKPTGPVISTKEAGAISTVCLLFYSHDFAHL